MILSQIVHKNIIKLLGCCLDADIPIFVYEYAAKGSLSDVLDGQEDFPLHLRVKTAVKTAEALEYLHSSSAGIIKHGYIVPSKILLDDNFMPKLAGFSWARRLMKDSRITAGDNVRLMKDSRITAGDNVIGSRLPTDEPYSDPIPDQPVLLKVKIDVYQFGVLLLVLISRKNFICYEDHHQLIFQSITAYEADNSGRAFFDEDITAEEDIFVLEEIGKLALKCISAEVDERPTMKEVAEHLWMIRRSWKKCKVEGDTLVSETEATVLDICGAEDAKPDALLGLEIEDSP